MTDHFSRKNLVPALLLLLMVLSAAGYAAGTAVEIPQGSGVYIQTARSAGTPENVNPTPFFAGSASVTENMKASSEALPLTPMIERLHSWAGWFVWGNWNTEYHKLNPNGTEYLTTPGHKTRLVQATLYAEPLCAKFIAQESLPYSYTTQGASNPGSAVTYGEWEGLNLATPVGALHTWDSVSWEKYPHAGDQGQGRALALQPWFINGLRVLPSSRMPSASINAIWGSSDQDIFAVGDQGTILHYDGSAWTGMTTKTPYNLYGVWGSAPNDVWAVGGAPPPTGMETWHNIILHYDGTKWTATNPSQPFTLYGVWGADADHVWAVGAAGLILFWNGMSWAQQASGTGVYLYGIGGYSGQGGSGTFAVGQAGTILQYANGNWTSSALADGAPLNAVWCADGDDAYAASYDGMIYHYNGTSWDAGTNVNNSQSLYALCGTGPDDVYAAGVQGGIFHNDGSGWTKVWGLNSQYLYSAFSSGSGTTYFGGFAGLLFSGSVQAGREQSTQWTRMLCGASPRWNPTQALVDRMGDFDIEYLLQNPGSGAEKIRVTMAQGAPFAWFDYEQPAADASVLCAITAQLPFASGTGRILRRIAQIDTGVDNLACAVIGSEDLFIPDTDTYPAATAVPQAFRYYAVYWDTTTTANVDPTWYTPTGRSNDSLDVAGIRLKPLSPSPDHWYFVVAALPQIQYPDGNDPNAVTLKEADDEAQAWAEALAPYAFNFVTDTKVTYAVEHDKGLLHTTFAPTLAENGPTGSDETVMCLARHHYGTFRLNNGFTHQVFDGDLGAVMLLPGTPGSFVGRMPSANQGHSQYWTGKGKLIPIAATQFSTNYVLANLLPFMPPPGAAEMNDNKYLWEFLNYMMSWDWQKIVSSYPPAMTGLAGGPQIGEYSMAGNLRFLASAMAVARQFKWLSENKQITVHKNAPGIYITAPNPQGTGYTNWARWEGLYAAYDWALPNPQPYTPQQSPVYDGKEMINLYFDGIAMIMRLASGETPYPKSNWGNGSNGVPADSDTYFRYVPDIGAVLFYPENVALPDGGLSAIAVPSWINQANGNYPVAGAFQGNTGWTDYHYGYGWMVMALAQAALVADQATGNCGPNMLRKDFFSQDNFGPLVDQLVMSIANDPDIASEFWPQNNPFVYSKMNFFDQWSGQGWTNGVPYSDWWSTLDYAGKEENTFGEAYQFWASVYLWGLATGRQKVADLGLYLATTALYNFQAYWADQSNSRLPDQDPDYFPGASQWSADGDWIPSTAEQGAWGDQGASFWAAWWYWGNTGETWGDFPYTSWSMKIQQGNILNQAEFGEAMPMPGIFSLWFPQAAYTLDFGRFPLYQQHIVDLINTDNFPDNGWDTTVEAGGHNVGQDASLYVGTVNQMRALIGLPAVYKDPRPELSADIGKSPWDWAWDHLTNKAPQKTVPLYAEESPWAGIYSMMPSSSAEPFSYTQCASMDSRISSSEAATYFWFLQKHGPPDYGYLGYSEEIAASGDTPKPVQMATAAFRLPGAANVTFVAFNPNAYTYTVNWWPIQQDLSQEAGQGTQVLDQDLAVPPHWFAVETVNLAAPAVDAESASGLTADSATVSGSINPNNVITWYYVEYGLTTEYGRKTALTQVGSGSKDVPVTASLTSLRDQTTYHYRVVAVNTKGMRTEGADATFTTGSASGGRPIPVTLGATGVTLTGATLNGSINPNGSATQYSFDWGFDTLYGSFTPPAAYSTASAPSATINGLAPDRTYHYRLVAWNSKGASFGADQTFQTGSGAKAFPYKEVEAPMVQEARPEAWTGPADRVTSDSASLTGTVNPNGIPTWGHYAYGQTARYGLHTGEAYMGAGYRDVFLGADIGGLSAKTLYHYRILAADHDGDTAKGDDWKFTTEASSAPDPSVQTGGAQLAGGSRVQLTGTVNPNGEDTMVHFDYGPDQRYGSFTAASALGDGVAPLQVSATVGDLIPGATYHYRAVARNCSGATFGADQTFTAPAAAMSYLDQERLAAEIRMILGPDADLAGLVPPGPYTGGLPSDPGLKANLLSPYPAAIRGALAALTGEDGLNQALTQLISREGGATGGYLCIAGDVFLGPVAFESLMLAKGTGPSATLLAPSVNPESDIAAGKDLVWYIRRNGAVVRGGTVSGSVTLAIWVRDQGRFDLDKRQALCADPAWLVTTSGGNASQAGRSSGSGWCFINTLLGK
ncbi:MAG: glycosyl hydrolase [Thermodesulfobacteriota bacterium]